MTPLRGHVLLTILTMRCVLVCLLARLRQLQLGLLLHLPLSGQLAAGHIISAKLVTEVKQLIKIN